MFDLECVSFFLPFFFLTPPFFVSLLRIICFIHDYSGICRRSSAVMLQNAVGGTGQESRNTRGDYVTLSDCPEFDAEIRASDELLERCPSGGRSFVPVV